MNTIVIINTPDILEMFIDNFSIAKNDVMLHEIVEEMIEIAKREINNIDNVVDIDGVVKIVHKYLRHDLLKDDSFINGLIVLVKELSIWFMAFMITNDLIDNELGVIKIEYNKTYLITTNK